MSHCTVHSIYTVFYYFDEINTLDVSIGTYAVVLLKSVSKKVMLGSLGKTMLLILYYYYKQEDLFEFSTALQDFLSPCFELGKILLTVI